MKIRCLLLTGSVGILQYTASQFFGSVVYVVDAHRLNQDVTGLPGQAYFIDQNGQLETVEDADQKKIQAQAEKIQKEKEEKLNKQKDAFKAEVAKFSKFLEKESFEKAMDMKSNLLENENVPKEELDKVKINTKSLFQKGFQFAEVARNDYAAEQLEELEIAEKNFNSNLDNKDLLTTFLNTATTVKTNLSTKYQDQWADPAAATDAGPKEDTGDE